MPDTADFFRSHLDQMVDLRHQLAVLPSRLPRHELPGLPDTDLHTAAWTTDGSVEHLLRS